MSDAHAMALVTGAGGFLGRALVASLLADAIPIRGFDDGSAAHSRQPEPREGLDWRRGDVCDPAELAAALVGVDRVFHLAVRGGGAPSDLVATHRVNAQGTLGLLEAARAAGVSRVVIASSWQVRDLREGRATRSSLAVEKLAGEVYGQLYHRLHALGTVSLRYFPILGTAASDAEAEEAGGSVRLEDAVRVTRLAAGERVAAGTVLDVGPEPSEGSGIGGAGRGSDTSGRARPGEATGTGSVEGER